MVLCLRASARPGASAAHDTANRAARPAAGPLGLRFNRQCASHPLSETLRLAVLRALPTACSSVPPADLLCDWSRLAPAAAPLATGWHSARGGQHIRMSAASGAGTKTMHIVLHAYWAA